MAAIGELPNIKLTVVEDVDDDGHGWSKASSSTGAFDRQTLFASVPRAPYTKDFLERFTKTVESCTPDIIVDGYGHLPALEAMLRYRRHHPSTRLILWSESTFRDSARDFLRERMKARILTNFDAAIVAGHIHKNYLVSLNFPADRIHIGGGCIDNYFFESQVDDLRAGDGERDQLRKLSPFFLFVGRFVAKKNITGLIHGYAEYRKVDRSPWNLVLVGDGPDREAIERALQQNTIDGVHLVGSRTTAELVAFYASAGALVLPSLSEPWGLVVNEAMASALPVLASNRCGCVEELIEDGKTGWLFDPTVPGQIPAALLRIARCTTLRQIGQNARRRVRAFNVHRYAAAFALCVESVRNTAATKPRNQLIPHLLPLVRRVIPVFK